MVSKRKMIQYCWLLSAVFAVGSLHVCDCQREPILDYYENYYDNNLPGPNDACDVDFPNEEPDQQRPGEQQTNHPSRSSVNNDFNQIELPDDVSRDELNSQATIECYDSELCAHQDSCGRVPRGSRRARIPYIQDGRRVEYGEWPFYARVYFGKYFGFRSGALITDRHVLVSASHTHLLEEKQNVLLSAYVKPEIIRVHLGDHNTQLEDEFEQVYRVVAVFEADRFLPISRTDNWAVLVLKQRVVINDYTQPACLPFNWVKNSGYNSNCYVVGAGKKLGEDGKYQDGLVQKVRVKRVSCQSAGISDLDRSRECYIRAPGDTGELCPGDVGAAVFCSDDRGRWTIVALISGLDFRSDATKECTGTSGGDWLIVSTRIRFLLKDILKESRDWRLILPD